MNIETIERVKERSQSIQYHCILQEFQGTNQSYQLTQDQTERTFCLTILFNNIIDLNLKEIIALYDTIDKKLFDHYLGKQVMLAERNKFDKVSQLENQSIVVHLYKNSLAASGYILQTQQLVVIKQIKLSCQKILIQNLNEYKIHHKINQLYPKQSLQLIPPVSVSNAQNYYEIAACMERARFNLFDYQNLITNDIYAFVVCLEINNIQMICEIKSIILKKIIQCKLLS